MGAVAAQAFLSVYRAIRLPSCRLLWYEEEVKAGVFVV